MFYPHIKWHGWPNMGKESTWMLFLKIFLLFLIYNPQKYYKQLTKPTKIERIQHRIRKLCSWKQLTLSGKNSPYHTAVGGAPSFPAESQWPHPQGLKRNYSFVSIEASAWCPVHWQKQSGLGLTYSYKGSLISGLSTPRDLINYSHSVFPKLISILKAYRQYRIFALHSILWITYAVSRVW